MEPMRRRPLALLAALLLLLSPLLYAAAPVFAAVDVAKQVLIGADYANKDLVGATFNLSLIHI